MNKLAVLYKGKKAPLVFSFPWLQEPISFSKSNVAEVIETDAARLCSEFPRTFVEFKGELPKESTEEENANPDTPVDVQDEDQEKTEVVPFEQQGEYFLCPYCDKQYKEDHGRWEARILEHVAEEHPAELEKHIVDEGV